MLAGEIKKDCKRCQQFRSPENFAPGIQVKIIEAQEEACETCEVMLSQPIPENEDVVDLYTSLPQNYDGMTGLRIVTTNDISFVFDLYGVPVMLHEDYYNRIMYLWNSVRRLIADRESVGKKPK